MIDLSEALDWYAIKIGSYRALGWFGFVEHQHEVAVVEAARKWVDLEALVARGYQIKAEYAQDHGGTVEYDTRIILGEGTA